jgi:hypothetical protein
MTNSLWPNFFNTPPPRGMHEMLQDAAGDISARTNGAIEFYVDALGVGPSGVIRDVRYNCYLRVPKNNYLHLLFRVTTPVGGPFPATATTPEGDSYPPVKNENELRATIQQILQRERTKEVVLFLLNSA